MATIKMRRLRANMPDEGRNIVSEGNIIYTDVLGQNGLPLPLYKEFPVTVQIPYDLPATTAERTALVTALKDEALEQAKTQAQKRANDMADKAILRSLITALNQTVGIDFEGTVEIPQE